MVLGVVALAALLVRSPASIVPEAQLTEPRPADTADTPTAPREPSPSPSPDATPTSVPPLPVDGEWVEVPIRLPDDEFGPSVPPVLEWDGERVVALGRTSAVAYDPAAAVWRPLPDLPIAGAEGTTRQGAVVDGLVVVLQRPLGPDTGLSGAAAARLEGAAWQTIPDVPSGPLIGTTATSLVVAQDIQSFGYADLVLVDVRTGVRTDLEAPFELPHGGTLPLGDGFVLLGSRYAGGSGTPEDPFDLAFAAARWSPAGATAAGWTALPAPPLAVRAAVHVPGADGGEGRVVAVGTGQDGGSLRLAVLDLDAPDWVSVAVDLPPALAGRLDGISPAIAWDGEDTVWVHVGYATAVQLALDLRTLDLRAAVPADARVDADLAWTGEGLVLLGGSDATGVPRTIDVWSPTPGTSSPGPDLTAGSYTGPPAHLNRGSDPSARPGR